jgi:hypothetical protein
MSPVDDPFQDKPDGRETISGRGTLEEVSTIPNPSSLLALFVCLVACVNEPSPTPVVPLDAGGEPAGGADGPMARSPAMVADGPTPSADAPEGADVAQVDQAADLMSSRPDSVVDSPVDSVRLADALARDDTSAGLPSGASVGPYNYVYCGSARCGTGSFTGKNSCCVNVSGATCNNQRCTTPADCPRSPTQAQFVCDGPHDCGHFDNRDTGLRCCLYRDGGLFGSACVRYDPATGDCPRLDSTQGGTPVCTSLDACPKGKGYTACVSGGGGAGFPSCGGSSGRKICVK